MLRQRLAEEVSIAREAAGMSTRALSRALGISHGTAVGLLQGDVGAMSIDHVARAAEVLGLQLAAQLHPNGDPVRDRPQLGLLARFRARLSPALRWRAEVPMPIAGDLRSGDGMIGGEGWDALVEAETHLGDIQLIELQASAKQRDLGARRLILLVSDTRHNREVLRLHPEIRERFPIDTRTCLRRLMTGVDPGGDALVVL